ncbi:hypothetical protein QE152_g1637 [Popillia japonica]|uniref:C2H2-type domain-containing protein n=1 Tax=Popillia japonica TaxID=7064 RepID=A0AAW1N7A5_POPJA
MVGGTAPRSTSSPQNTVRPVARGAAPTCCFIVCPREYYSLRVGRFITHTRIKHTETKSKLVRNTVR